MSADKDIPLASRLESHNMEYSYDKGKHLAWVPDDDLDYSQADSDNLWHRRTIKLICAVLASIFIVLALVSIPAMRNKPFHSAFELAGAHRYDGRILQDDIFNTTLGFQKLLVINLAEEPDHRDSLVLAGAVSDIHFEWIAGVWGDDVPLASLPPGPAKEFSKSGIGSWRAHINAIRAVVEQNLTTAVIFEDDIDWDIRLKSQLVDLAQATRALTQRLEDQNGTYADPTFPIVHDDQMQPDAMDFDGLPDTEPSIVSPYGDNWDLLWLGHCGQRRPTADLDDAFWHETSKAIPKGHVAHYADPTVPEPQYIHVLGDDTHPRFRADFPPHTRIIHHSMDGVCTLAYAITQAGVRKLLLELAVRGFDDYFDIMLREWCQAQGRGRHARHTCLTVQPTLFDTHIPVEGERGYTANIRWSTWRNLEVLLSGEGMEFEDQFPDAVA